MSSIKLSDSNIVITDRAMLKVYNSASLNSLNSKIINDEEIFRLNLSSTPENVIKLKNKLNDYFFYIAGSSNFHHIDIANLVRIHSKLKKKIQLITFDYHMDCGIFTPEANSLHCGNWISYAYHIGLIDKLVIIGSGDYRNLSSFNSLFIKNDDLIYQPNIDQTIDIHSLNPDAPTYISIDTDVVNEPNDWGRGRYSLKSILNSPTWEQLSHFNLVGACILGHVTDNRKIWDYLKNNFQKRNGPKTKYSLIQSYDYLIYSVFPKLWASLTVRPLPLHKQLEIILAFYKKIDSIRLHK